MNSAIVRAGTNSIFTALVILQELIYFKLTFLFGFVINWTRIICVYNFKWETSLGSCSGIGKRYDRVLNFLHPQQCLLTDLV